MWKVAYSASISVAIAGLVIVAPADSRAQIAASPAAPSQVTPQSLRPDAASSGTGIALSGQTALTAPPGTADLNVIIGDVQVEGGFAELASQTDALVRPLVGQRVTIAQVYALAQAIEKSYAQAGFALARVTVPPQQLLDRGKLTIHVVDGFIEEIDLKGVPDRVRAVVVDRVSSLVGQHHLKLDEIERCLLTAGDIPGFKLKSTLARGTQNGGTKLVLEGTHRIVTGSLDADDRLPQSLGVWQLRGAIAINSAFEFGEQIYGTAGLGTDVNAAFAGNAPLTVYGGGVVVPVGKGGLTVNPEYTHSVTQTPASPGTPFSIGTFERFAFRIRDPLIWTRSSLLNANVSLEYITQQLNAPVFVTDLNEDAYGVVRLGPDYATKLSTGTGIQAGVTLSQGLGGRSQLDATASSIPLSRSGASPDFTKFTGNARISQPLPGNTRFDLIGTGQLSFGAPMLRSEQFVLDGPDAVSAFASGTFSADQGATVRGEWSRPFATQAAGMLASLSPYVFAAAGRGWLFNVTSVEQSVINAGALGFGARSTVEAAGFLTTRLGVELARQYTDVPNLRQGWRANVNATVAF